MMFWSSWGGFGSRTTVAEGPATPRRRTTVEEDL